MSAYTVERYAVGQCLAAAADDITAAVVECLTDRVRVLVKSPYDRWQVEVSPMTDNAAAVMPCGSDGRTRNSKGKPKREAGYVAYRNDMATRPRECENAAMKVIGRSELIHKHEGATA